MRIAYVPLWCVCTKHRPSSLEPRQTKTNTAGRRLTQWRQLQAHHTTTGASDTTISFYWHHIGSREFIFHSFPSSTDVTEPGREIQGNGVGCAPFQAVRVAVITGPSPAHSFTFFFLIQLFFCSCLSPIFPFP